MHYKQRNHDDKEVASLSTIDSKSELGLETIPYHAELVDQGRMISMHPSLSQRATIFQALDSRGHRVVVKGTYRSTERRFREPRLLRQVHANGEIYGVVRQRLHNIPGLPH